MCKYIDKIYIMSQPIDNSLDNLRSVLKKTKKIPFWSEDPNVLFQQEYIFEFFPIESMTYEQKLNAVSRTVIVLTIVSYVYTQSSNLVAISAITMFAIFLLFFSHQQTAKKVQFDDDKEGFDTNGIPNPAIAYLKESGIPVRNDLFANPQSGNPFSNVLIPEYSSNPNRLPAPPAYTENSSEAILAKAKQMVVEANPDQPNIADKLFNDLGDELVFEQSMRPFYSTANSTIPNDQSAFADFCYGSMVSCKEGNMFACARNNMSRYNNY